MTLLDRPTLVDRPELVNRDKQDDEEDEQDAQDMEAEALGEGGGPVVHSIEFEPGQYEIVAAANAAAVLSTGQDSGDAYSQSFRNAAIQLYELQMAGENISDLVRFSMEKGVAENGLNESEIEVLTSAPERDEEPEPEPEQEADDNQQRTPEAEEADDEEESDEDTEIEDVEDSLEEVKEDEEEDEG